VSVSRTVSEIFSVKE